MLNHKTILRKKSQHQLSTKELHQHQILSMKRKKSNQNLKKKQDHSNKYVQKSKQQHKLVHSHSKGKLSKKNLKNQKVQKTERIDRNDQNVNSLNHKKSIDKIKQSKIHYKQLKQSKTKISTDRFFHTEKQEKIKSSHQTGHGLVRTKSLSKINPSKNLQSKTGFKKNQKKVNTIDVNNIKNQGKKSISIKIDTVKKPLCKNKIKKISGQSANLKRPKLKAKKISQIIQKSILYSQVNFDFKQQISFLVGSGIKQKQDFYLPYPFQSQMDENLNKEHNQMRLKQYKAAILIQKNFRGYIQRKYIREAQYIIDSIKRIQRFWKACLLQKVAQRLILQKQQKIKSNKNEIENSLITIKDLNTQKKSNLNEEVEVRTNNFETEIVTKNNLKDLLKNILVSEGVHQTIKQKIRKTMASEQDNKQEIFVQRQFSNNNKIQKEQPNYLSPLSSIKTQKQYKLDLQIDDEKDENNLSKDLYVRKKINMQINSERNFNSPMNSSSLVSPGMKKLVSPKCLSNSFSKQMKANYNHYFKSTKNVNGIFSSPKKLIEQNQRIFNSHSGQKRRFDVHHDERFYQLSQRSSQKVHKKDFNNFPQTNNIIPLVQLQNSPIIQCSELQNNYEDDINLLQSQKFSQIQTQRFFKKHDQPLEQQDVIKPFPTAFALIEQFCFIITDYLRMDEETIQIFVEKLKGLKFFKIERIFKEWENLEFQQMEQNNRDFVNLMMRQQCQRPTILSRTEKQMIMELPSLRVFLHQNRYEDNQIQKQNSPQNAYIKFIFDVFEEAIYENFAHFNIKNLYKRKNQQKKNINDYLSIILCKSLENILHSAQMLCGSFHDTQQPTEYEKLERQQINEQRMIQMTKIYKDFDYTTCETWIIMLIYNKIFDEIITETAVKLLVKV